MAGKTGNFTVTVDRVIAPRVIYAERRKDYVEDIAKAFQLMNALQDEALERAEK